MSNPEKPSNKPELEKGDEEYFKEGLKRGHEAAQTEGLEIGQLVYHPSDDRVYELKSVENGIAIVWIPAGIANNPEDIIKEFPYAELIDPKAAYRGAMEAKVEDTFPSILKPKKDIN